MVADVKLAFGLQVHELPSQVAFLLNDIHNPDDVLAMHVDARTEDSFLDEVERLAPSAMGASNVHLIPRRPVVWGSWDVAQIELDLIHMLLAVDADWTHFINLSGACLMLMNRARFTAELSQRPGANFIDVTPIESDHQRMFVVNSWSYSEAGPKHVGPKEQGPYRLEYEGYGWHVLTRAFCEELCDERWHGVFDYMRDILVPDEHFVQHVVMNTPFRDHVLPSRRFAIWNDHTDWHPATLETGHFDAIMGSGAFTARKLRPGPSNRLQQLILDTRGPFYG